MNTQNILKFYGSKLDLALDYSEFYDFEMHVNDDYDKEILDLLTPIQYSSLTINSNCITGATINDIKPWIINIDTNYTGYTCDFIVNDRPELGWTLDFVFNKENLEFSGNTTFYYLGIVGTDDNNLFVDNNLSFGFTESGSIFWKAYRYSGYCDNVSGYTDQNYLTSGQTVTLCENDLTNDFNVTITFKRYNGLFNCELENDGGVNDLITDVDDVSGLNNWLTGSTNNEYTYELNKKSADEKHLRLGTLRVYINGRPIYKIENWEEVVPSKRGSEFDIIQSWGGLNDIGNIHDGVILFNLKQIKYFEEPLSPLNVKHHYITEIKQNYNINECGDSNNCVNDTYALV